MKKAIKTDQSIQFWLASLFSKPRSQLLTQIESRFSQPQQLEVMVTPNPEQIIAARQQPDFAQALLAADWRLPDGIGLVWASRLLAHKAGVTRLENRIPGVEIVEWLTDWASREEMRVLVVGGRDYAGRKVHQNIITAAESYSPKSTTQIFWTLGYDNVIHPTKTEESQLVSVLARIRPAIVLVAFGAPQQELWIHNHRQVLAKSGVRLAMAVGGSLDFLTGRVKRAPLGLRALGLEWLCRLVHQPWRWRRQLSLFRFIGLVVREALT